MESPTEWSPFGRLCQNAGSITRANVGLLIERLNSVPVNFNAEKLLAGTAAVRVEQWADEARRLSATEPRAHSAVRRRVLLLCVVQTAKAKLLDDLCTVLVRIIRKMKHRTNTALRDWLSAQHRTSEELLVVFSEVLQLYCDANERNQCHDDIGECLNRAGGVAPLLEACEARLQHRVHDWRAFLTEPYRSQRSVLLNILAEVPLRTVNVEESLLTAVPVILELRSERDHWVRLKVDDRFLGRYSASGRNTHPASEEPLHQLNLHC